MKFKSFYLEERFVNLIGDDPKKKDYADEVWDVLQRSYKPIGGIKGSGFSSKEEMIKEIPFWKLNVKDGKIISLIMYKDVGGRKSVALGTDGSREGIQSVSNMMSKDLYRSFGEKSGPALGMAMKSIPWDTLKAFIRTPSEVAKILPDKKIIPLKNFPEDKLEDSVRMTLQKFPVLKDYGYFREISGKPTFKVMIGTPGLTIEKY